MNDACVAAQTTVVLAGATVQGTTTSEPLSKAVAAAPEEDDAVNSMLAPSSATATGSNMDWTNLYTEPVQPVSMLATSSRAICMRLFDFSNGDVRYEYTAADL